LYICIVLICNCLKYFSLLDDEWEDLNSSESSAEESAEAPMEEDVAESNSSFTPLCVSTELHSAYVSCGIVEKVRIFTLPYIRVKCKFCMNSLLLFN
jgi:hypothetical protein